MEGVRGDGTVQIQGVPTMGKKRIETGGEKRLVGEEGK